MSAPAPFDPVAAARRILREARTGGLATLLSDGAPFASLVTVATDPSGAPLLLLSSLAVHTTNLIADPRASLLLEGLSVGDPLQGGRISVNGTLRRLTHGMDALARRRFLARQPEARLYAGFKDFDFWQMAPDRAHLVAGFGRIVQIPATDLLIDRRATEWLVAAEERVVADLVGTPALSKLLGTLDAEGEGWRLVGLDADGLDFGRDGATGLELHRIQFPRPLTSEDEVPALLEEIAAKPFER
jgi:putative heme iron utilization protein